MTKPHPFYGTPIALADMFGDEEAEAIVELDEETFFQVLHLSGVGSAFRADDGVLVISFKV